VVGFWVHVATRLRVVSIVPDPDAGDAGHNDRGKHPRVRHVEVGPDGLRRRVYRDFDPALDKRFVVERRLGPEILMLYAGPIAAMRKTGHWNKVGAARDVGRAKAYLSYLVDSEADLPARAEDLWLAAEAAVDEHWLDIDALAAELLSRGTMAGREVEALLLRRHLARARAIIEAASHR